MKEHSWRGFISDLHHVGPGTSGDQFGDGVLGVVVHGGRQIGDGRIGLPRHWHALFAWIGPVVAVVEVNQEAHARILDLFAEGNGVGDVIVAIGLVVAVGGLGIDEGSQADGVESVRFHDGEEIGTCGVGGDLLVGHVCAHPERGREATCGAARAARAARAAGAGRSTRLGCPGAGTAGRGHPARALGATRIGGTARCDCAACAFGPGCVSTGPGRASGRAAATLGAAGWGSAYAGCATCAHGSSTARCSPRSCCSARAGGSVGTRASAGLGTVSFACSTAPRAATVAGFAPAPVA